MKAAKVSYVTQEEAGIGVSDSKKRIIDQTLDHIYQRNGKVTPELLVREAKNPRSAVHKYFEWDNNKAAEKYRLRQAMDMIIASKFVALLQSAAKHEPAAVVAISQAPVVRRFLPALRGEGFKMRKEVLSETELRKRTVERKKAVLRAWCREVIDIEELSHLRQLILDEIGEEP